MTRSTNMEHVEVLRDLSEVCRAAIKAGDWKVDGACDPDSLLRHADAAIAPLAQQPAACVGCEGNPAPENNPCAVCGQQPAAVDGVAANSAVAAIQFALKDPEGMTFLRLWNEGDFDTLRREWPDAPVEVYIDAEDYARACVAHATAEKDAEIEALRAEVERLTFEMGCLQQQYDERTSYVIVHRGAALACSESAHAAYTDEHHRAERLAEALRGVLPFVVSDVLEHCDGNKCREQWCAGCMGDEYAAEQVERARAAAQEARAALRDHDQGGGNP